MGLELATLIPVTNETANLIVRNNMNKFLLLKKPKIAQLTYDLDLFIFFSNRIGIIKNDLITI